jgi:hypothetical protein
VGRDQSLDDVAVFADLGLPANARTPIVITSSVLHERRLATSPSTSGHVPRPPGYQFDLVVIGGPGLGPIYGTSEASTPR